MNSTDIAVALVSVIFLGLAAFGLIGVALERRAERRRARQS